MRRRRHLRKTPDTQESIRGLEEDYVLSKKSGPPRRPGAPGLPAKERQQGAWGLGRDGQGLHAELLLHLEGLQPG